MKRKVAIIGDGLTAMLLAWKLQDQAHVHLWGNGNNLVASLQSAAILTPVANKKNAVLEAYAATLQVALEVYREIEQRSGRSFLRPIPVIKQGQALESPFMQAVAAETVTPYWRLEGPFFQVNQAYQVDTQLIGFLRDYFHAKGMYTLQEIQWTTAFIQKVSREYDLVCCCEGAAVRNNPLFASLPFTRNKGDVLHVAIPGLPADVLYDFLFKLVPLQKELFWVGSNNVWDYETVTPEPGFKRLVTQYLETYLKLPFQVQRHICIERPTIAGQQAIVQAHESMSNIWVLNGLGARGYLKAPQLVAAAVSKMQCCMKNDECE